MRKKLAVLVMGCLFLLNSCYYDKEDQLYPGGNTCNAVSSSFANVVKPIIETKCAITDCHAAGSANGPGPLTSYALIQNAAIEIKSAVASGFMPKTGSLTAAERQAIICWV